MSKESKCGGITMKDKKDVNNYKPPVGPKHQSHQSPGLPGGTNHGNSGTQGKR